MCSTVLLKFVRLTHCASEIGEFFSSARLLNTTPILLSQKKFEKPGVVKIVTEDGKTKKKKPIVERITLIGTDESICVSTKDEAEKISKRRDLKLVKIAESDSKTQRPVYKLMTGAQFFQTNLELKAAKKQTENKSYKLLTINHAIAEHDLKSKLKSIPKWLKSQHIVRVLITGDANHSSAMEKIIKAIESDIVEIGKINQKIVKATSIKLQVVPLKVQDKSSDKENLGKVDTETSVNV